MDALIVSLLFRRGASQQLPFHSFNSIFTCKLKQASPNIMLWCLNLNHHTKCKCKCAQSSGKKKLVFQAAISYRNFLAEKRQTPLGRPSLFVSRALFQLQFHLQQNSLTYLSFLNPARVCRRLHALHLCKGSSLLDWVMNALIPAPLFTVKCRGCEADRYRIKLILNK